MADIVPFPQELTSKYLRDSFLVCSMEDLIEAIDWAYDSGRLSHEQTSLLLTRASCNKLIRDGKIIRTPEGLYTAVEGKDEQG